MQEEHADEWLQDVLDGFGEDDYVVFDCPGQARPSEAPEHQATQVSLHARLRHILRLSSIRTRRFCARWQSG